MQRFKYVFLLFSCIAIFTILATQTTEAATRKPGPPKVTAAATRKPGPPKIMAATTTVTSTLFGITALSSTSAWAVGTSLKVPQFTGQSLIEQWNGSNWQNVPGPVTPQSNFSSLIGVTALSSNNAWAVGFSMNPAKLTGQPLIEHWDGNTWQIVPNANTLKSGNLSAITALGPDNIWAVGSTNSDSGAASEPLIEHWDGTSWQVIPEASTTGNSSLLSIAALGPDNIWAVGSSSDVKKSKTLIEHWNGSTWLRVPGPVSGMNFNVLSGVTAISDHDIWAVGNSFSQPLQVHPSLIHWNGSTWNTVSTTGLPATFAPNAIKALSANDIWIIGAETLAHWNGSTWQSVPGTSQKGFRVLNSITAPAPDNVWVAGFSVEAKQGHPLIEHWDGSNWQSTSLPEQASKQITKAKRR